MAYIFLSFAEKLEKKSSFEGDFYKQSLNDQFKELKKRMPAESKSLDFERFIEICFPSGLKKKYFISFPNFLREENEGKTGNVFYLNNVVIRPEITPWLSAYLPENQNIILVGDIAIGEKLKKLIVKGIQFIDDSISSPYDIIVDEPVCKSFEINRWPFRVDYNDTYFTPDTILDLKANCYTVENPEYVMRTYKDWQNYIHFRNYYLKNGLNKSFKLDKAERIEAYAISKNVYKENSSYYDGKILDNNEEFKKGDMIILSEKVKEADYFPLIRLDIIRNNKESLNASTKKNGKPFNKEESIIRRLVRDNVFITPYNPKEEDQGSNHDSSKLGDGFKFIRTEIEPKEELEALEADYRRNIKKTEAAINAKYKKIIDDQTAAAIAKYTEEQQKELDIRVKNKKKELSDLLEKDVSENKDPQILDQIKRKKTEIETLLSPKTKKEKKKLAGGGYREELQQRIDAEIKNIDIRALYSKRNEDSVNKFKQDCQKELNQKVEKYRKEKRNEITSKYNEEKRIENEKIEKELKIKLDRDKENTRKEKRTIKFSLYFKPDSNNKPDSETVSKCTYIAYNKEPEQKKIDRQKEALKNFFSGNVKNPYLSAYLFNPQNLPAVNTATGNLSWYLDSLNDKQKEAVEKAVSSNSIFLLQGPPGTGKTQVIAETVAQLVKKGKKVLISSETHKAIDNVFERLPKIAEIVAVRLIPSNNKKNNDNNYDPGNLVDEFYSNLSDHMKKAIKQYKNMEEYTDTFSEKYRTLEIEKSKIDKMEDAQKEVIQKKKKLNSDITEIDNKISEYNEKKEMIRDSLEILETAKNFIDDNKLDKEKAHPHFYEYKHKLKSLFDENIYTNTNDVGRLVKNIYEITLPNVERERATINPFSEETRRVIKKERLERELGKYVDDATGDVKNPGDTDKAAEIIGQLRELTKAGTKSSALHIAKIFRFEYLVAHISEISEIFEKIRENIDKLKKESIENIEKYISDDKDKQESVEKEIDRLKQERKKIQNKISEIDEIVDIKDIKKSEDKLNDKLKELLKDLEISEPPANIAEALKIIKQKYDERETAFNKEKDGLEEKIPIYESISKYLSKKDVVENDRKYFTEPLFERANVFGITSTARNVFNESSITSLSDYNIGDVDIKTVGIDVVIIDEVSKLSFIDLLIPILYGRSVILVGDHRQLPPMYDLEQLHGKDFEGLDEEIINKERNKEFAKLYKECFFKTLFEKIPESYKSMLVQQYRCHEHIMNVFNCFYQNKLKLGFEAQNQNKKHNITLRSNNGKTIIEPDKHIYFVNCNEKEEHYDDSTSIHNNGEARVIAELLKKLNNFFIQYPDKEKLSIGVICTYGDQVRTIKSIINNEHIKTNAFKTDPEKMIVSTVDDFQGDERDIIIFSAVRNPVDLIHSNPGFILAYQRINVALSRARRMLIMVGNREYLESKGVIKRLPDIDGREGMDKRNFRVYETIIETIERDGKVIKDIDVLNEKGAR